jgi:hypothetical protein
MPTSKESFAPIVADLVRGMTVSRNPNLFQCLPAENKHELEMSPEFISMRTELEKLKREPPSEERDRRRRQIYAKKQKIKKKELRNAQETQPCERPWEAKDEIQSIDGYRSPLRAHSPPDARTKPPGREHV